MAACLVAGPLAAASPTAWAEEGLWTFDNFPAEQVRRDYGWSPDAAWLAHARSATARLSMGCSSGLVSPNGLLVTNQHCVLECQRSLSAAGRDLIKDGFVIRSMAEERRCPGLAAEVLTSITDVTAQVQGAAAAGPEHRFTVLRDAEIARIEAACAAKHAGRCQVVPLYLGGQYKLYQYRRYDDVRLVFAPELAAAFFGGDPDNYQFPRYGFDVAFLRIYSGGRPLPTPERLAWSPRAPKDGELVFLVGDPGSTSRSVTMAQLFYQRDLALPWRLVMLAELRGRLLAQSAQGPEPARILGQELFDTENQFKRLYGRLRALQDPEFLAAKARQEAELRAGIAADPDLASAVGDAFDQVTGAHAVLRTRFHLYMLAEGRAGWGSELFDYARHIVRGAEEGAKPDADRMPAYTEGRRDSTGAGLLSDERPEPMREELLLAFWLSKTREHLGSGHPVTGRLLGKESPEALARRLVTETRLGDPAERRRLWRGGKAAVDASRDPLIQLARRLDPDARAARDEIDALVESPAIAATARIAKARFAIHGDRVYPDGTGTPRISYGRVAGWTEPDGREIAPVTVTSGLYDRATGHAPYALAPRWSAARTRLSAETPFNFTTTVDSVAGSSGSPLVDRTGAVIGLVHDGNIHSLGGEYAFDPRLNRAIHVSAAIIDEALVKTYGQQWLADELRKGPKP